MKYEATSLLQSNDELHIASFVVLYKPELRFDILAYAATIPLFTVEIDQACDGKFVAVWETKKVRAINDLIKNFEAQKGVMSVSLVYHQCERASELDKELVGA